MPKTHEYHAMAMELADRGDWNRRRGLWQVARDYYEQALDFELYAIDSNGQTSGLGWAVMHRSAATLALDCCEYRQAERIAAAALLGDPHPVIAAELRDLLHTIWQFGKMRTTAPFA